MATTQLDTAVNDLIDTLKDGREKLANKGITLSSDAGFREIIDKIDDLTRSSITLEAYNFNLLDDYTALSWTPSDDTTAVQISVNDPEFHEYTQLEGYQTYYRPGDGIPFGSTWYIRPISTILVNGQAQVLIGPTASSKTAPRALWVNTSDYPQSSFWFCGPRSFELPRYPNALHVTRYNLGTGEYEANFQLYTKYNLNTLESPHSLTRLDAAPDSPNYGLIGSRLYLDWEETYAMLEEHWGSGFIPEGGYIQREDDFHTDNQMYLPTYQNCIRIPYAEFRFDKAGRYIITSDDGPEGWYDTLIIDVYNCVEASCEISD